MSSNMDWIHQPIPHIRIPKALFNNPNYNWMHPESKIIYGCLQDRAMLSLSRGGDRFRNEKSEVFVVFPQAEIMDRLHCGHDLAATIIKELVKAKLIRVRKNGCGRPYEIYVRPVVQEICRDDDQKSEQSETGTGGSDLRERISYSELIKYYPAPLMDQLVNVANSVYTIPSEQFAVGTSTWITETARKWVSMMDAYAVDSVMQKILDGRDLAGMADARIMEELMWVLSCRYGMGTDASGNTVSERWATK